MMDTAKADNIVQLVGKGWTTDAVAKHLNVSPTTVKRVRAAHAHEITELRDLAHEETASVIATLIPKALRRLAELIDSPNDPVALGASKFVIDAALRWRNETEIERRLKALEGHTEGGTDDWTF